MMLARTGNPTAAAAFSGVNMDDVAVWRQDDQFICQYDNAMAQARDWLRFWAWKRAVEGVDIPYFFKASMLAPSGCHQTVCYCGF